MKPTLSSLEATRWLKTRRALAAPRARLLCLPYAGGGAVVYHHWSAALPQDVEVRAAQLPGRQERLQEPAQVSLLAVVQNLVAALRALPPAPLVIYGHSYGSILAFELARALRGTALAPRALVVAARGGPQMAGRAEPVHRLPEPAFKDALHVLYGIPRHILAEEDLMELALPSLRGDFEAVETYQYVPGEPLDVPITVLWGTEDRLVTETGIRAWQELSALPVRFHSTKAGHLFVDTHRAWVLQHVAAALHESAGESRTSSTPTP